MDEDELIGGLAAEAQIEKQDQAGLMVVAFEFREYFESTIGLQRTIRIDSDLLSKAENDDHQDQMQVAGALHRAVAAVGRSGEPGKHVQVGFRRSRAGVRRGTEYWR